MKELTRNIWIDSSTAPNYFVTCSAGESVQLRPYRVSHITVIWIVLCNCTGDQSEQENN